MTWWDIRKIKSKSEYLLLFIGIMLVCGVGDIIISLINPKYPIGMNINLANVIILASGIFFIIYFKYFDVYRNKEDSLNKVLKVYTMLPFMALSLFNFIPNLPTNGIHVFWFCFLLGALSNVFLYGRLRSFNVGEDKLNKVRMRLLKIELGNVRCRFAFIILGVLIELFFVILVHPKSYSFMIIMASVMCIFSNIFPLEELYEIEERYRVRLPIGYRLIGLIPYAGLIILMLNFHKDATMVYLSWVAFLLGGASCLDIHKQIDKIKKEDLTQ